MESSEPIGIAEAIDILVGAGYMRGEILEMDFPNEIEAYLQLAQQRKANELIVLSKCIAEGLLGGLKL